MNGGMGGSRARDHVGRKVDGGDLRTGGCDLIGEMAGAAADVEDTLAALRSEEFDEGHGHFPDEGMLFVVKIGVPLGIFCQGILRASHLENGAGGRFEDFPAEAHLSTSQTGVGDRERAGAIGFRVRQTVNFRIGSFGTDFDWGTIG